MLLENVHTDTDRQCNIFWYKLQRASKHWPREHFVQPAGQPRVHREYVFQVYVEASLLI